MMRALWPIIVSTALAAGLIGTSAFSAKEERADPLPSWNEGDAKKAIVEFIEKTTDRKGKQFVPPEQRIATFDQDGTLWVEHPMYIPSPKENRRVQ